MKDFHSERIRFEPNTESSDLMLDVLTTESPDFWRGMSINFELVVRYDAELADVSDYDSITLSIKPSDDITGLPLMEKTVSGSGINTALTEEQATERTAAHAVFHFSYSETLLAMNGKRTRDLFLFIYAQSTTQDEDGNDEVGRVPIGQALITIRESGLSASLAPNPVVGSSIIPAGSAYSGAGSFTQAVTANKTYEWVKNANDTSITNGTEVLTSSGRFDAQGSSVTLTGSASQLITATLRNPLFNTAEEVRAMFSQTLKSIMDPGAMIRLRSPNGAKTLNLGIDNDGNFIQEVIDTPAT